MSAVTGLQGGGPDELPALLEDPPPEEPEEPLEALTADDPLLPDERLPVDPLPPAPVVVDPCGDDDGCDAHAPAMAMASGTRTAATFGRRDG